MHDNQPSVSPKKKTYFSMQIIVPFLVASILFGLVGYYLGKQSSSSTSITPSSETIAPTDSPAKANTNTDWKTHVIDDANLTFLAPPEMKVSSETHKYSETGVTYSLTMYVEKDLGRPNYYQLYGIYQWGNNYSQDSLNGYKEELQPESIKDVIISGFPAVEGQIKGQRNRFVTHILTNKGIFSLFTAEPTQENKEITDKILASFKFTN